MIGQCFTRASYCKQPKSGGVEYEDSMLHAAYFRIPEERRDTRDDRNCYVSPILDRGGRKCTDENIASDPSKCRSRKGKDEDAEDIKFVPRARNRAADRESKGSNEIEDREQEVDNYFFSSRHDSLLR